MLKITVEIIPFGIKDMKKRLGEIYITNDGTGNEEIGNYNYTIKTERRQDEKIGDELKGRVENFQRRKCNFWKLLYLILKGVYDGREKI